MIFLFCFACLFKKGLRYWLEGLQKLKIVLLLQFLVCWELTGHMQSLLSVMSSVYVWQSLHNTSLQNCHLRLERWPCGVVLCRAECCEGLGAACMVRHCIGKAFSLETGSVLLFIPVKQQISIKTSASILYL